MMGQRQREQVQRGCAVGTVVLLAWLCRVLPLEGMPSGLQEACGILRSLLYLSLFAGWGISLYNRTVHPQVRRLLLNVDLLMLFWILVRTLRFQLNTPPEIDRMLGYLYYAPMLGIPVLCVQLVLTVDRSERYRLSAWARMLWLPSAVLLELVLTNDLHQRLAGRPDAGRRHGAVCSGILDGAQAQGHALQVQALNPDPQRPRANAPLTLWAMYHIPERFPQKVTSQNLLPIAIP